MIQSRRRNSRSVLLLIAACSSFGMLSAEETLEAAPRVTYDPSPGAVVVEYFENVGEIADESEDLEARVRIFGDGTTVVHFPAYTKRAGDYSIKLSPDTMETLMDSLADKRVFEFDQTAARIALHREQAVAARGRRPMHATIDDVTVTLRVHVQSYRKLYSPSVLHDVSKEISWYGLMSDAKNYPAVRDLTELAAAVRDIALLANNSELTRID